METLDDSRERKNLIREYVRALNQGNAAFFAGAGLSIPSSGISWSQLLEDEAKAIDIDVYREHDLTTVAQYIFNEAGTRQVITSLIKNHTEQYGQLNDNHHLIASLPVKTVWTTNYDSYIENSFIESGKVIDVKKSVHDMATEINDAEVTIYKMHGDLGNPHNTVIIKDDYEIFDRKNELFTQALQSNLLNHTFLFFGFSFDDPNLQFILSKVRIMLEDNPKRHYCILKKVSIDDDEFEKIEDNEEKKEAFEYRANIQKLKVNDLKRYGIKAVLVNEYSEMTDVLESISKLYLSDKIFISGAYNEVNKFLTYKGPEAFEKAHIFTHNLAERLHQENKLVKSGFGINIGQDIVKGFLIEDARRNRNKLSENLTITPFPNGMSEDEKLEYRKKIMANCGILIILFGNKYEDVTNEIIPSNGIYQEYKVAKSFQQLIIPVGATGYVAEELWKNKINFSIEKMNEAYEKLMYHEQSLYELTEIIIEIIKLYRDNIDKIQRDIRLSNESTQTDNNLKF